MYKRGFEILIPKIAKIPIEMDLSNEINLIIRGGRKFNQQRILMRKKGDF